MPDSPNAQKSSCDSGVIVSRREGFRIGKPVLWAAVVLLALPFLAFLPYQWLVFDYAQYWIVTPSIVDQEHRNVHLGVWFAMTYGPFTVVCTVFGTLLLAWSLLKDRRSPAARFAATIAWLLLSCCASVFLGCIIWLSLSWAMFAFDYQSWLARLSLVPAILVASTVFLLTIWRRRSPPKPVR